MKAARILIGACLLASAEPRGPRELIDFLNYQKHARPGFGELQAGIFSCGTANADRTAAIELIGLGEKAIPEIEKELREIEKPTGRHRYGARWIQQAYAQLRGRSAYDQLFRIAYDSRQSRGLSSNEDAIALALGITSYVTSQTAVGRNFRCSGPEEPRDALNRLLAGWLRSDRDAIVSALAPAAKASFENLAPSPSWRSGAPEWTAVGYQFDGGGSWAEPAARLSQTHQIDARQEARTVELTGQLKSFDGQPCDNFRLRVVQRTPAEDGRYLRYAVDLDDVAAFLQSVSTCAQRFR